MFGSVEALLHARSIQPFFMPEAWRAFEAWSGLAWTQCFMPEAYARLYFQKCGGFALCQKHTCLLHARSMESLWSMKWPSIDTVLHARSIEASLCQKHGDPLKHWVAKSLYGFDYFPRIFLISLMLESKLRRQLVTSGGYLQDIRGSIGLWKLKHGLLQQFHASDHINNSSLFDQSSYIQQSQVCNVLCSVSGVGLPPSWTWSIFSVVNRCISSFLSEVCQPY